MGSSDAMANARCLWILIIVGYEGSYLETLNVRGRIMVWVVRMNTERAWYDYPLLGRSCEDRTPMVRLRFAFVRINRTPMVQLQIRVIRMNTECPGTVIWGCSCKTQNDGTSTVMVWGHSYKHRTPTVRLQFGDIRMNTECPRVQLLLGVVHMETEHPSMVSIGSFGDEREHLSIHDRYEGWVVR